MPEDANHNQPTMFGHPVGLYTLFFAEMWERFSYYGMRALLTFYMIKGFLGYADDKAYRVYGAYTALVYMTPFFGGLISDRILGSRRAVILGGLLMAAGHLMMTVEDGIAFYFALALLICGNGFFKPNISTLVGSLYPERSKRRDGGFTIFYIGINLGAAMSPLLCGYIGENYGWHRGFGLATIGMLTGLAVFVAPNVLSQVLLLAACCLTGYSLFGQGLEQPMVTHLGETGISITALVSGILVLAGIVSFVGLARGTEGRKHTTLSTLANMIMIGGGALVAAYGMLRLYKEDHLIQSLRSSPRENIVGFIDLFVTICLVVSAVVACTALARGGLPVTAGEPHHPERLKKRVFGVLPLEWAVYLCALLSVPVFMLFVSGFDPTDRLQEGVSLVSRATVERLEESESSVAKIGAVFLGEFGTPAGLCLLVACVGALIYIFLEMARLARILRDRMAVALILTFFSLLFWALFEQAGSSLNNFADRNIDRVSEDRVITAEDVGQTIQIQPTQEQLGYRNGGELFTLTDLTELRNANAVPDFTISWTVAEDNVGMGLADRKNETPASTYQAVNPVYILVFGLIFTALWGFLADRGLEPSTPFKFALGLLQLGLGYAAFWYGALSHDPRGMVWVAWLFLGYLLHTTGELCLSPVGLSMITKLSARHLVSTMMGMWFLATAMSQFLAGIIAQFTKVDSDGTIPAPIETVGKYGGVYGMLAAVAIISSAICFVLVPLLKRWMHEGVHVEEE